MKFFIENQKVERELQWVLAQVRLHMNGAVTGQMEEGGIIYRENYGVATPHLKQLARRTPVSFELAERLWFIEIRETMLLAALIAPEDQLTPDICNEWVSLVTNKDIAERSAMFLWSRIPHIEKKLPEWIDSQSSFIRATALNTIGRLVQKDESANLPPLDAITESIKDINLHVLQAASFAFRMLLRAKRIELGKAQRLIKDFQASSNKQQRVVIEEILTEIDFLNTDL